MRTSLLTILPAAALWLAGAGLIGCFAASRAAARRPSSSSEPAKPPELFTVRSAPFHVELRLEGLVEAAGAVPLRIDVRRTTELVVLEAAPLGAQVAQGDVVLRLDPRALDEALEDQRLAAAQAALALTLAQKEEAALAARTALDLGTAAGALVRAHEDLTRFEELERPWAAEQAEFGLKAARDRLAYEEEELKQLDKMYKDDDLTEETEEIVLRRQRDAVEAVTVQVRAAELQRGRALEVQLPRQAQDLQERLDRARIDAEQAQATLPVRLEQKRAETRRLEHEHKRQSAILDELTAERSALTLKAPIAGTVHYGPLERGRWPQAEALAQALRPHGKLAPQTVVLTIAPPGPLRLQAWVDQAETARELAGQACNVQADALPGSIFPGHIATVEAQPHAERRHGVIIELDPTTAKATLRPGWQVQARLIVYREDAALAVPRSAVREDPLEPGGHLVYLPGEDGRPRARKVQLGQRTATQMEIREGLAVGESILLNAPAEP